MQHIPIETYGNPQVAALPNRLCRYIVPQPYDRYTPVDHAVWRYVMRQNYSYLKDAAYYPYIPGLKHAGLTIERIPSMQEINDALTGIGWGAVTVDGFIPPAAFMEYQAFRVLVIAADIRQLDHIEYTSAPDIIHESAGHAPIISDAAYNRYLSRLGEIGTRAIFSHQDQALYEAIRALSILKELPHPDPQELQEAEDRVAYLQENMGPPSEMALLSRLQWWTVEYGLIGSLEHPKIYGAGLLSSIGESQWCMGPEVRKIPYTIDAVHQSYDITKPQPQLFVTPTFQHLLDVLETFEAGMAWKKGGTKGLQQAIDAQTVCTAVFSSGLQLSGVFSKMLTDDQGCVIYVRTQGPSVLSYQDVALPGHGADHHHHGYGSPVGPLALSETDLLSLDITPGRLMTLRFASGIMVEGVLTNSVHRDGRLLLLTFQYCTVMDGQGQLLFSPDWGLYDMAVGDEIVSVFGGTADREVDVASLTVSVQQTDRPEYTPSDLDYQSLFRRVREVREHSLPSEELLAVIDELQVNHPNDWLCRLEILEILEDREAHTDVCRQLRAVLNKQKTEDPSLSKRIDNGLGIIDARLRFE
jgi:phenylalanine-4-hydroxylase